MEGNEKEGEDMKMSKGASSLDRKLSMSGLFPVIL